MKLILIPPFQSSLVKWGWVLRELVANFRRKGQLEGVEVDVDEGYLEEGTWEIRGEVAKANVTVGIIKKVREYSEMDRYDGIVLTGCYGDPGFMAARAFSKIPVAAAVHSSFHVASLIGDRFSAIHGTDATCLVVRNYAQMCGFSHKLASVRPCGHPPRDIYDHIIKYKDNKEERVKVPEIKKIIDDITTQGIMAIEKDRADSLILGVEPLNLFEDDVRQRLDEAGYSEVPIIGNVAAAVEMAKTLVDMRLIKAARAYPTHSLRIKPEYR